MANTDKTPKDAFISPETVKLRVTVPNPTVWINYRFAPHWYMDCVAETQSDGPDARRREIIFAVSLAESYIFEWAMTEVVNTITDIVDLFAEDDRRGVSEKWREVPRQLHQAGLIPGLPDFGGAHGTEWKRIIGYRNGLIHAGSSRPETSDMPEGMARPVPSKTDLDDLKSGWALGVVVDRIQRLHRAAGTSPPDWLTGSSDEETVIPDERQTAYHEAGHAVALYWHGLRTSTKRTFKSVSIEPEADTLGRMIHLTPGEWWNPEFGDDRRTAKTTEVHIITSLAGRHAESRAGYEPFGYESDHESASVLVMHLDGSPRTTQATIDLLDIIAEETFDHPKVWSAVEALVEALLKHRTLKWREARSVLQPILGPWKLPT